MAEKRKVTAEDRLAALLAINRGFGGGEAYGRLAKRLARQAGYKP